MVMQKFRPLKIKNKKYSNILIFDAQSAIYIKLIIIYFFSYIFNKIMSSRR